MENQSLDEKEKMARVQAVLFGPHRRKNQEDGNGPPKTGSEPNNVRLCSPMFAYVRLFGKKIVEAQPAESDGQSNLIQADEDEIFFLNPNESAS